MSARQPGSAPRSRLGVVRTAPVFWAALGCALITVMLRPRGDVLAAEPERTKPSQALSTSSVSWPLLDDRLEGRSLALEFPGTRGALRFAAPRSLQPCKLRLIQFLRGVHRLSERAPDFCGEDFVEFYGVRTGIHMGYLEGADRASPLLEFEVPANAIQDVGTGEWIEPHRRTMSLVTQGRPLLDEASILLEYPFCQLALAWRGEPLALSGPLSWPKRAALRFDTLPGTAAVAVGGWYELAGDAPHIELDVASGAARLICQLGAAPESDAPAFEVSARWVQGATTPVLACLAESEFSLPPRMHTLVEGSDRSGRLEVSSIRAGAWRVAYGRGGANRVLVWRKVRAEADAQVLISGVSQLDAAAPAALDEPAGSPSIGPGAQCFALPPGFGSSRAASEFEATRRAIEQRAPTKPENGRARIGSTWESNVVNYEVEFRLAGLLADATTRERASAGLTAPSELFEHRLVGPGDALESDLVSLVVRVTVPGGGDDLVFAGAYAHFKDGARTIVAPEGVLHAVAQYANGSSFEARGVVAREAALNTTSAWARADSAGEESRFTLELNSGESALALTAVELESGAAALDPLQQGRIEVRLPAGVQSTIAHVRLAGESFDRHVVVDRRSPRVRLEPRSTTVWDWESVEAALGVELSSLDLHALRLRRRPSGESHVLQAVGGSTFDVPTDQPIEVDGQAGDADLWGWFDPQRKTPTAERGIATIVLSAQRSLRSVRIELGHAALQIEVAPGQTRMLRVHARGPVRLRSQVVSHDVASGATDDALVWLEADDVVVAEYE